MKRVNIVKIAILSVCLFPVLVQTCLAADGPGRNGKYEDKCNHTEVLINEDGSKPTKEQYALKARLDKKCQQEKAEMHKKAIPARAALKKKYNIDASGMSDREAVYRFEHEEERAKQTAKEKQEAKEQKAASAREKQMDAIMKQQKSMMKSMGISLPTGEDDKKGQEADDDDRKTEEQMYQKMVDGGAAPQCKGKKGDALIKCVDAALDAN